MSSTRVPFDPELPFVVAAQELPCGDRRFVRGDRFPWRDLGLTELDMLQLHSWLKVDCVPWMDTAATKGDLRAVRLDDGKIMIVTAGELVTVEPPAAKKKRSGAAQRATE